MALQRGATGRFALRGWMAGEGAPTLAARWDCPPCPDSHPPRDQPLVTCPTIHPTTSHHPTIPNEMQMPRPARRAWILTDSPTKRRRGRGPDADATKSATSPPAQSCKFPGFFFTPPAPPPRASRRRERLCRWDRGFGLDGACNSMLPIWMQLPAQSTGTSPLQAASCELSRSLS